MRVIAGLVFILCCLSSTVIAATVRGRMEFPNSKGVVIFDHNHHSQLLQENCKVCHDPPGEIKGFGKAYAHRVCIGCHTPPGAEPIGPYTCEGCHTRE